MTISNSIINEYKYCKLCGDKLNHTEKQDGYDMRTGNPKYRVSVTCPSAFFADGSNVPGHTNLLF